MCPAWNGPGGTWESYAGGRGEARRRVGHIRDRRTGSRQWVGRHVPAGGASANRCRQWRQRGSLVISSPLDQLPGFHDGVAGLPIGRQPFGDLRGVARLAGDAAGLPGECDGVQQGDGALWRLDFQDLHHEPVVGVPDVALTARTERRLVELSGVGSVYGIDIPVGPLLIILIGLAIVVRAFQPRW